jgi:hypothetical protein
MLLQKNLAAIEASTASITANSDVVKHSTSVTEEGIKRFLGAQGADGIGGDSGPQP